MTLSPDNNMWRTVMVESIDTVVTQVPKTAVSTPQVMDKDEIYAILALGLKGDFANAEERKIAAKINRMVGYECDLSAVEGKKLEVNYI